MKRLIAVSDSHGLASSLREAATLAMEKGRIDVFVFLGDGEHDFEKVRPLLLDHNPYIYISAVRGNNDYGSPLPDLDEFFLGSRKCIATHGHLYRVKYGLERLCYAAQEREATLALFGHTHHSHIEEAHGVLLVNPGSVSDSGLRKPAYAQLLVDENGQVQADLISWSGLPL